jgi:hypothetical protein
MSRSEQVELKPCPFCGGNVTLTTGGKSDGLLTFVCDEGSTCRGSKIFTGTLVEDRETAITAWNTRAPSALPVGWKLLPVEPTEAMVAAAVTALGLPWREIQRMLQAYRAMLSASPPADHVPDVGNMISPPEPVSGWRDIATAPRDRSIFLGAVDGVVRLVSWGKTSHVPIYGFCLADQGAEDYDLCEPSCWQPLPSPPSEPGVK